MAFVAGQLRPDISSHGPWTVRDGSNSDNCAMGEGHLMGGKTKTGTHIHPSVISKLLTLIKKRKTIYELRSAMIGGARYHKTMVINYSNQ